jgi:hypothetical protein
VLGKKNLYCNYRTSGGRSVGVVCLRTTGHEVYFLLLLLTFKVSGFYASQACFLWPSEHASSPLLL